MDNLPPYRQRHSHDRSQGHVSVPSIDSRTPTNITFTRGKTAILICVVRNLGNTSVSWLRHRDISLLGLNEITNSKDKRIKIIHKPGSAEWGLRITDVQPKDAGIYECQLTTPTPTSRLIKLNVLDPVTEIVGPPEVFLNKGSRLNLTCIITGGPKKQEFIMWNHNNKILSYSSAGANLTMDSNGRVISTVVIQNTNSQHSGIYKCEPGHAPTQTVTVHVLTDDDPAAVQGAHTSSTLHSGLFVLSVFNAIAYNRKWRLLS